MPGLKAKLTKRTVDAAQPPASGDIEVWDTDLKGFCLRVTAKGAKTYALKYRIGAAQRWLTIGRHGSPWTPETARKRAQEALDSVRQGEDPAGEKKAAREALTVASLIDAYISDGPATKLEKRASSWYTDASNLNRHLRPLLGKKSAHLVTHADAARAVRDITDGKTAVREKTGARGGLAIVRGGAGIAARTRTVAAAMWKWGLHHKYIAGENPFAVVKLPASSPQERFLSREEAGRVLDAIATLEKAGTLSGAFADALRLLLLTGARKTEILGLRWSEVDFTRKLLTLPPARTKAGGKTGARRIALSPPTLEILSRRLQAADAAHSERAKKTKAGEEPLAPSPFVFPAARGDGHAIGLRRAWVAVCAEAELCDVRIHDLRHSFASFAIADGASLFLIGKALGHSNTRTTERYAHLSGDPLADLAAAVGARIVASKSDEGDASVSDNQSEGAVVVPIRGR